MRVIDFSFDDRLVREFVEFGYQSYARDPAFIPPLRTSERHRMSADHPQFRYVATRNVLVKADGEVLGRASAFVNPRLNVDGRPVGSIGRFECIDDTSAASRLFDRATTYLRNAGVQEVLGPMDGSTWYRYRLLDHRSRAIGEPMFGEPYNHSYYPRLFETCGFEPVRRYRSSHVQDFTPFIDRTKPLISRFFDRGYAVRQYRRGDATRLWSLALNIFKHSFAYTDCDRLEFLTQNTKLLPVIPPGHVLMAYPPEGSSPVGFIITMPDYGAMFRRMDGVLGPRAIASFALRRQVSKRLIVRTLGALPGLSRVAVGRVLLGLVYQMARSRGYTSIVHAHMDVKSESIRINETSADTGFRAYTLYRMVLGSRAADRNSLD